ncbi:NAD(P)-binding protein [Methylogaea oryzae]|uniref:NAD(P)-binding protein n=2 Tax=Methylogaea oryzae TaxID=1295382 RepID=UPI001C81E94E|nr:NAD(P)-binding protein [Methylogaea oryzae]
MSKAVVVAGGGLAGLFAALFMRLKYPAARILVVERSSRLGGLYATFDYGDNGHFDCGMHWITETGISAVDEMFFELLPFDQWHCLSGERRDLSGLFFKGRLQKHTQYPDLRAFDESEYRAYVADFFFNLQHQKSPTTNTLFDYANNRFGALIAERVIAPIAEKVHGFAVSELAVMARRLPLLDRVTMFDEETFSGLIDAPLLRNRLAFPEQRRLPLKYSSGIRSYYPKQYGISRIIDALLVRLRNLNIELLTSSQISQLKRENRRVSHVVIESNTATETVDNVEALVWTAGSMPLSALLGMPLVGLPKPRRKTVIVSMLLKEPPQMGDLYCFFCADSPYSTYRITNFAAFCPDSVRATGYPICVELLVDTGIERSADDLAEQAKREILAFGLVSSPDDICFARAEILQAGFPGMSCAVIEEVDRVRNAIVELDIANLVHGGILSEPDLFFQPEVIADLYRKLDRL